MPEGAASRQLAEIAARLKATGDRGLRLQMMRGLKAGTKPLIDQARERARETLPHSGGLNDREADQPILASVRTGARTAGVRVVARKLGGYQADRYGYVRHPVFGKVRADGRRVWAKEPVQTPDAVGWFTNTFASGAGEVTPQLLKVLEETAAAIQGGL